MVPHCILIKKLKKLGVKNKALDWFKSYLTNRSQCVDINGHISSPKNIDISVMQGSVLGPLLFLCFVNDLHTASKLFTLLFADDTCCLASGKNLIQLIQFCNEELQKIANWFSANKLAVNVGKCKFIFFHNKGKKLHFNGEKLFLTLTKLVKTTILVTLYRLTVFITMQLLLKTKLTNTSEYYSMKTYLFAHISTTYAKNYPNPFSVSDVQNLYSTKEHCAPYTLPLFIRIYFIVQIF